MAIILSKLVCSTVLAAGFAISLVAAPAYAGNVNGKGKGNSGGTTQTTSTTSSGGTTQTTSTTNSGSTTQTTSTTNSGSTTQTTSSVACSTNNVSLGGIFATACKGSFNENNDTGSGDLVGQLNNGLFNIGSGATWSLFGKSDEGDFFATKNTTEGSLKLNKALASNTFVISLKSSNSYSAYLFKDFDFTKQGALAGLFDTIGVSQNNKGKAQDLSHASIFIVNQPPKKPVKTKVPEPASIIGIGLVTGAMFMKRRRKSNSEV